MKSNLTEIQVQRLVDGELSESDRRQLLRQLEAEQSREGWRTVALGFLEARQLGAAYATPSPAPDAAVTRRQDKHWLRSAARQSVMLAASTLLGVSVVLFGHSWLRGPRVELAENSGANPPAVAPEIPQPVEDRIPDRPASRASRPVPVMNVNLGGVREGDGPSVSVPVYSQQDWPAATRSHPESLSAETQRQLEEQGYRIERVPEWFAAPLENGGHVLIPTERVRIQPVVN